MLGWLRRNPRVVILAVVGLVILGGFLSVIGPLFATSGLAQADIAGSLPTQVRAGTPLEVDIAMDNTGDPVIIPVCIGALTQGPISATYAVFQGIDREPFHNGRSCGGALSSQESISVRVYLDTTGQGSAQLVLSPMEGAKTIGSAISGSIRVLAP